MDYQSNKRPISPVNNGEEHVKRGRLSLSDSILPEVALSEDTCLYPGQPLMHDNANALLSDNVHETLRNISNLHDLVIDTEDLFQTVPRYSNPAGEAESNDGDISTDDKNDNDVVVMLVRKFITVRGVLVEYELLKESLRKSVFRQSQRPSSVAKRQIVVYGMQGRQDNEELARRLASLTRVLKLGLYLKKITDGLGFAMVLVGGPHLLTLI
ncbi:hypothetical protein BKA61DRAFT_673761 [Leptodontidium sp. MPI-SDFR-AT-0119]|nr:hypothetical protein BKA61DRAFT_673761 [Leptodontidium sp. MPI-SDFR-AT-0119]